LNWIVLVVFFGDMKLLSGLKMVAGALALPVQGLRTAADINGSAVVNIDPDLNLASPQHGASNPDSSYS